MRRLLPALVCIPAFLTVMAGCSSDSPPKAAAETEVLAAEEVVVSSVETDSATVSTEPKPTENVANETTTSVVAESRQIELVEPPTFSMVAAAIGVWPNPVPKASVAITDIDTEALCAMLKDGGAFAPVEGEYYEGKTSRNGDELAFTCKYRRDAGAPVALDAFAGAFVAAASIPVELPFAEDLASLGRVTFTAVGNPLDTESSDYFDAGARGCAAAGDAVGLPAGWRLETIGSVNDNQQIICRGPVPSPEVVTADPALVAKAVGSSAPPLG